MSSRYHTKDTIELLHTTDRSEARRCLLPFKTQDIYSVVIMIEQEAAKYELLFVELGLLFDLIDFNQVSSGKEGCG